MISDPENFLRSCFDLAVAAADPMKTIPAALPVRPKGRVVVIGAGKASARMAEAVEHIWGPCEGLVITRYGYGRPTQGVEIVEAAHPVSDDAGIQATKRMLDLLQGLGPNDLVLALISGGGSSLLCAPPEGMDLTDMQAVHRALLESGAPINQMNVVRKHLCRVKGGQLAAAAFPAQMLCLMISDVPGDDPADIASGPTVGEVSTAIEAKDVVRRFGMSLPATALAALDAGSSVRAPSDPQLANVDNRVISAPAQSLEVAAEFARRQGVKVQILGDAIEGEARDEARRQVELAVDIQGKMDKSSPPVLLLSGGECTVSGWGGGVGGPNAEFALSAAIALAGQPGIHLLACDTDGVDGAAEVAGAIVDPLVLQRARALGVAPDEALSRSDSHNFFETVESQVVTGPTLTNVNDFRAILVEYLG